VTEKRRRVIENCLVSKLDDHRPWNKETTLLDKERKSKTKAYSLL
jgi:hypothetical protein